MPTNRAHLIKNATATATGTAFAIPCAGITVQASVAGTGAVSATVLVEVSNDNVYFMPLGTITLTGASPQTDGFAASAAWCFIRANVTALSGTGATVNAYMGA